MGTDPTRPAPPPSRERRLESLREGHDVIVVGGGVTGAGLALDLALRGLRVAVLERGDWAGATSSASSRLIHGGLRYLEQFEFGLVRESCLERALLLRNAAGLVWPERFAFPVRRGDRVGRAKLMAGMSLYTLLSLPRPLGLPSLISAAQTRVRVPGMNADGLRGAGSYLDAATDDARLCLAVIRTALSAGATCLTRVEVTSIDDGATGVAVAATDRETGERLELRARACILAGGPFTEDLRSRADLGGRWIAPTRGSHLILPRHRLPTDGAVIFASPVDGRVMFLIPWIHHTVVGTTDLDQPAEDPSTPTFDEVQYLLDSANGLVPSADLGVADVISTWSGLRPLLAAPEDDPSARSREERVEREGNLYTIAGGKLTGFRSMAEQLGARVARDLGVGNGRGASPTRSQRLHGGLSAPVERPDWSSVEPTPEAALEVAWRKRYAAELAVVAAHVDRDGPALDASTRLGELEWSIEHEDVRGLCDFLFRRTDVGYGTRADVEAASEQLLERAASRLDWNETRVEAERAELACELDRLHGWRSGERP
jgi:glycerol-3-phosphate dehydrogenase